MKTQLGLVLTAGRVISPVTLSSLLQFHALVLVKATRKFPFELHVRCECTVMKGMNQNSVLFIILRNCPVSFCLTLGRFGCEYLPQSKIV